MKCWILQQNLQGDQYFRFAERFRNYGKAIECIKVSGNGMSAGSEILLQIKIMIYGSLKFQ